ncbi:MAG: hypothetical protein IJ048_09035, partial [Clostridia bacterium]|nr:hypothetical protein [Clostridia bacterium]
MTKLYGLPLETALARLGARAIEPDIEWTGNPRRPLEGTPRVVRVSSDGRRLTCARFPDGVRPE